MRRSPLLGVILLWQNEAIVKYRGCGISEWYVSDVVMLEPVPYQGTAVGP